MAEVSTSPPLPPPANNGLWWLGWILATVIIPGFAGANLANRQSAPDALLMWVVGSVVLILHIASSIKLDPIPTGIVVFLLFGGWVLVVASFFAGCALNFKL